MTKKDFQHLERIFAREISNTLPLQSKSKHYEKLENEGLVLFNTETSYGKGNSALDKIPLKISGWYLTDKGRMLYCEECENWLNTPS